MQGISAKHRVRGHSIVNSIPVVGPLASPLLGNGASTPSNPQPATSPTAGSGSSGGNGKGNGNGNGNGGGNGDGQSGGDGSGGGANPPNPVPSSSGGGGTAIPPSPASPSPTPPNPAPGNPSISSAAQNANGVGSPPASSIGGSGGFLGTGTGQTAPINVASAPSSTSAAIGASTPIGLATASLAPSQSSPSAGSNTATPFPITGVTVSSGKELSADAVAGIIVVCLLFLLAIVLLIVRRRSIARRLELRRQWWFGRNTSSQSFSIPSSGSSRNPVGMNGEASASRLSARSSFATNFDQGLMFRIDSPTGYSPGSIPDLPPMAEVRERNSILISTGGSVARRASMNSMLNNVSDPGAQYLTVSTAQDNFEPSTPMSVRPFSPSESFAFPKPPPPPQSAVDSFFMSETPELVSPQSSSATLIYLATPSPAFMADIPPPSVPTTLHPQALMPCAKLSPATAGANPSSDPFADPAKPEFSDVEVIRRPFTPSLDDELAVHPGDHVRIFQIFDDGWAFVEKLASTAGERQERGLIPVDCFRQVDQALPTFLTEKRVSYGSVKMIGTAL